MDGTFGVASYIFSQLYVIEGRVNGVLLPLPLVYVLLLKRKTQTLRIFEERGCDQKQLSLTLMGLLSLTQSIWCHIQSLGLRRPYEKDNNLFCGQVDAFFPLDEAQKGMEHLRSIMPDEADPRIEYFDST